VERVILSDSVIHARDADVVALKLPRADTRMHRCTLIGRAMSELTLDVERLDASDSIVAGRAEVTNTQAGCFRFSACGPGSIVPHPYQSTVLDDATASLSRTFASLRFGDAEYASLAPVVPRALLRGAEQGLEMGAFNNRMLQIKQDCLGIKIDEHLPFGRLPNYLNEN